MTKVLFSLMIISLLLLIIAGAEGFMTASIIFKATTSLLFILVAISGYLRSPKNNRYFFVILMGMIFSLFGDVFLSLIKISDTLIFGMFSFLVAQIIYIYAFSILVKITSQDFLVCAVLLIPALCAILLMPKFDFEGLLPLVVLYAAMISFMAAKAISLRKIYANNKCSVALTVTGGLLFYISDFVIVFDFFYIGAPKILSSINLLTYYFGQGFIALSFYKGISLSWRVRGKKQAIS